jgi:hypothetical protein
MRDADLLRAAIEASGLSARRFAVGLLARDERTIRRWLAGDPMPEPARAWCERWLELSDDARSRILRAFG